MKDECIVFTRFAPDQPGYLDFSYRIKALARAYRLTVVSAEPLDKAELMMDGVQYLVLPQPAGRMGWFLYLFDCARLIRKRRPACAVLLHSLLTPIVWLAGRTPTALYWNEHPSRFTASPPSHPFIKRLARKLALRWMFFEAARRADLVMPIGEAHLDDLLQNGCDPLRVKLIYMGVDSSFAQVARQSGTQAMNEPIELIYVGTVHQARGRDLMLEALHLANKEKTVARLTMVGADSDQILHCNNYAKELGISDAVRICGRVDGALIPELLSNADAGLCLWEDRPWWRFNPPTKLFEYLAAGLPVIASDIRTHTQYISHGSNGLIFQYNSQSLAQAIAWLAQRRQQLPKLKDAARDSGSIYLWDRLAPSFLHAIASLHKQAPQLQGASPAAFEDVVLDQDEECPKSAQTS